MAGSGLLSGGIVFAIAAALWIVYLMPTWLRRNEFLATERNAIRLQQTLRILAEAAETPDEIRVETTARSVAEQQKILKKYEAEALERARLEALAVVEAQREAERARQSEEVRRATRLAAERLRRRRARRRARLAATVVLAVSLAAVGVGGFLLATGGSPLVIAAGAITAVGSISVLVRMARVAGRTRVIAPVAQAAPVSQAFEPVSFDEAVSVPSTWTPTPLPRPLHLSQGSSAAGTIAQADAHAALRRAALAQVMAERAVELAPQVTPLVPAASAREERAAEPASRFAGMGVVNESEIAPTDLTALLQRRRAAS